MSETRRPDSERYSLFQRLVVAGAALLLVAYLGWNLGGAWLWRAAVPPTQGVHVRLVFSNETHGPVTLTAIMVGTQSNITRVDLPKVEDEGRYFFDFVQADYVTPMEVLYRIGAEPNSRRLAFVADARLYGECELELTFDSTAHASACGSMVSSDSVPWDAGLWAPPRSTLEP